VTLIQIEIESLTLPQIVFVNLILNLIEMLIGMPTEMLIEMLTLSPSWLERSILSLLLWLGNVNRP
jgi:hypothetical protein